MQREVYSGDQELSTPTGQRYLAALRAAGFSVTLAVDRETLLVTPASRLTEYDRQDIREHKQAMLDALEAEPAVKLWGTP